jgi:hypothetical protein
VCKAQWCYACGVKWKSCSCPPYGFAGQTEEEFGAAFGLEHPDPVQFRATLAMLHARTESRALRATLARMNANIEPPTEEQMREEMRAWEGEEVRTPGPMERGPARFQPPAWRRNTDRSHMTPAWVNDRIVAATEDRARVREVWLAWEGDEVVTPEPIDPAHRGGLSERNSNELFTGGINPGPTDNPTQTNDADPPPGGYRARTLGLLQRQGQAIQNRVLHELATRRTSAAVATDAGSAQAIPRAPSPARDRFYSREHIFREGEPLPVGFFQRSDRHPTSRQEELLRTMVASQSAARIRRSAVPEGALGRTQAALQGERSPPSLMASGMRRSAAPERDLGRVEAASQGVHPPRGGFFHRIPSSSRRAVGPRAELKRNRDHDTSQGERAPPSQSASKTPGMFHFMNQLRRGRTQNEEAKVKA